MKRFFDILLSLIAICLLFMPILFLCILIYFKFGSPIFFIQTRPGLKGKPFNLVKFRSMLNVNTAVSQQLSDAARLTPFGKLIRASSLDELPELWNVLKGEMSLVGPRPLLMEYLPLYTPEQFRRHDVLPGVTGWAQINGRNAISWEEKFKLDLWYVCNHNLFLDIKILWITICKVVIRDGINAAGEATMKKFKGTAE